MMDLKIPVNQLNQQNIYSDAIDILPPNDNINKEKENDSPETKESAFRERVDEYVSSKVSVEKEESKNDSATVKLDADSVLAEIKRAKEKKQQVEQEMQSARDSGDADKIKNLEDQMSKLDAELTLKDNDSYKMANANRTYTMS